MRTKHCSSYKFVRLLRAILGKARGRFAPMLVIGLGLVAGGAHAQTDFYHGRRIIVVVGSAAGAGYDAYARLMTRHLGRFIKGNPTFIVQNMPGGGGATAASNLFALAPKDGTTLGGLQREVLLAPLLESRKIEARYEARKFNWIGSLNSEIGLIVVRAATPHQRFEDLYSTPLLVGSTGPATELFPLFLNKVRHTKFKIVAGYPSSTEIYLAMERGEIEGRISNGWSGDKGVLAPWLASGKVRLLASMTLGKSELFKDVPSILTFAASESERQMMNILIAPQYWGRPFAFPPGVPRERTAEIRSAFGEMVVDPDFLAEAKRLDVDIAPIGGDRIEQLLAEIYELPPELIERTRAAIGSE